MFHIKHRCAFSYCTIESLDKLLDVYRPLNITPLPKEKMLRHREGKIIWHFYFATVLNWIQGRPFPFLVCVTETLERVGTSHHWFFIGSHFLIRKHGFM